MAKVAVVDNNRESCEVLGRLLQHAGHDVDCIVGSRRALELLRELRPDLLVLDVNMPELNGLELLEILRRDPLFTSLPVVMLSAIPDPQAQACAYALGAREYIIKGTDWASLIARLETHLAAKDQPGEMGVRAVSDKPPTRGRDVM
jgi:CheY-like chemotaxis protein